jgi:WXXGXW repeat (2 copies)
MKEMKTKLLALFLLAGGSLFAAHFSVGIGVGVGGYAPYGGYYVAAPPPVVAYAPPPVYARPGYTWINGYYYPVGARYVWRAGYWARPPYAGAVWVGPRWAGGRYYAGGWRRR